VLGATPSGGKILNFSWVSAAFTISHYKTTQSERKMLHSALDAVVLQHTMRNYYTTLFFHHLLAAATKDMMILCSAARHHKLDLVCVCVLSLCDKMLSNYYPISGGLPN
jgi:hypothetical protein